MARTRSLIIGLTGGIGSGKTLVSDTFAKLGIDVIDADLIAREVVAPGSTGLAAITEHFSPAILNEDGTLNRAALREKVFTDESEKRWLNACLHPLIRAEMQHAIANVRSPYGILAVPLLIENHMENMVDEIVVVDCPESLQLTRALSRDGSSEAVIKNIINSQVSRENRLAAADHIIDNSQSIECTTNQVELLHHQLKEKAAQQ